MARTVVGVHTYTHGNLIKKTSIKNVLLMLDKRQATKVICLLCV